MVRGRGLAGGAADGALADLGYFSVEGLVGNRVDRHLGGLAQFDIDDVGFIHHHFGRYDRHVGDLKQHAAHRVLNPGTTFSPTVTGSEVTMPSIGET